MYWSLIQRRNSRLKDPSGLLLRPEGVCISAFLKPGHSVEEVCPEAFLMLINFMIEGFSLARLIISELCKQSCFMEIKETWIPKGGAILHKFVALLVSLLDLNYHHKNKKKEEMKA